MFSQRALVRRPSPQLAEGLIPHADQPPVDVTLAFEQWRLYVNALRSCGWETIEVPPADDYPNAAFIEDALVVYGDLAIAARPGTVERRPEVPGVELAARSLGYRIGRIKAPGILEGGDVLKHENTVWVGQGGHTNSDGIAQLASWLEPMGARVVPVPLTRAGHLKSAVTALPDGTAIGYEALLDGRDAFIRFMPVAEKAGAHVVLLNNNRLLMSTSAPKTTRHFRKLGYHVITVDIGEFEKLGGSVTSLSVRLRGV